MKVLFDQNMPWPLAKHLTRHDVSFAHLMGWAEIQNGDLIAAAEEHGFEILVTGDKNLEYQQRAGARRISIILLSATNWPVIEPHSDAIVSAVDAASPSSFEKVECGRFRRTPKERLIPGGKS